jgi:hypothetical protein
MSTVTAPSVRFYLTLGDQVRHLVEAVPGEDGQMVVLDPDRIIGLLDRDAQDDEPGSELGLVMPGTVPVVEAKGYDDGQGAFLCYKCVGSPANSRTLRMLARV